MATLKDEVNMRQKRPADFSVTAPGVIALEGRELRRAMAKASLRENWRLAEASRVNLSEEEIHQQIDQLRTIRRARR